MITELNCNLREAVHVKYLDGNLFSQDVYGNAIRVIVMDGDEPATLAGTVSGTAIREDGSTVALTDSRIDENVATVVLPAAAYAVPGVLAITIKISDTNTVTTLAYVVANVYRTSTDTVVDPGTIIPSITTLIEQIAEAVASIPADYSSLWAALAETFNASKSGGYAVGEYVTYDGGLYRFKNAHTGSWSSSDVDAVNLGSGIAKNASDISDLKSAFETKLTGENDKISLGTLITGKYIKNADGNESSSTAWNHTGYISVHGGKLLFTCPESNNSSAVSIIASVAFYSSNTVSSFISSVAIESGTVGETSWKMVDIPWNAKYIRLTIAKDKENEYNAYNISLGMKGSFALVTALNISDANEFAYNTIYIRSSLSQALAHIPYTDWLGVIMTISYNETFGSGVFQLALSKIGEMHIRNTWGADSEWEDWKLIPNDTQTATIADKQNGIIGRYSGAFTSDGQYIYIPVSLEANKQYTIECKNLRTGTITISPRSYATNYKYLRPFMDEITITNGNGTSELQLYNLNNTRDNIELTIYETEKLNNRKYIVSKNQYEGDYTSLTQCLYDLRDNMSQKVIEIWEGDYDIYDEYQHLVWTDIMRVKEDPDNPGQPYIDPDTGEPVLEPDTGIPYVDPVTGEVVTYQRTGYRIYNGSNPSANYYDYCIWVPSNTHIIGMGIVRLKWMPLIADTDITAPQSKTVSPLNVGGSVTIENIEVHCKNGRYCLHNDASEKAFYSGAIQHYKNVKFYKYANETKDGTALGFTPTTGFGIGRSMQHIYDDCVFVNYANDRAFYGHGRGTVGGASLTESQSGMIVLNNCILDTDGQRGVKLGNGNFALDIRVLFNNCSIDGQIAVVNETESAETTYTNSFDITLLNCGDVSMTIADPNNPYPPKAYRTNLTM